MQIEGNFKPFNYTLLPIVERAIRNLQTCGMDTSELDHLVGQLLRHELHLFNMGPGEENSVGQETK